MAYRGWLKQHLHQLMKLPAQIQAGHKPEPGITWVAGVPRSGTNMIMDAFDRHRLTRVFHEADRGTFQNYSLRPNPILQQAFARTFAPHIVAKALLDADRLPELLEFFPHSKAIWPVRNFADVINSHMVRWPNFRENIDEIATDQPGQHWRGRNASHETHEMIKSLYTPEISTADCKALLWLLRNAAFFEWESAQQERILVLKYEDLAQNPKDGCRALAEFSGLPYDKRMAKGIHTRSVMKTNAPQLNTAIADACQAMEVRLTAVSFPENGLGDKIGS